MFYNDKFEGLFRDPRPSLNLDRAHKWIPALCFMNVIDDSFARSHPSPINCYRPMRRLDFPGLTNERWFEIILIGAQVARVGVRLWQPLANESLNGLPPNRTAGDKVISLICSFIHFSRCARPSNFCQIDPCCVRNLRELQNSIGFHPFTYL